MLDLERMEKLLASEFGVTADMGDSGIGGRTLEAEVDTKRGPVYIFAISGGVRIGKPNGSATYLYECSNGHFFAVLRQIVKANS